MGLDLLRRAAAPAAALALAACVSVPEAALSPLDRAVPEERPPDALCGSLVYGLTCVAPAGYDLVEESPGPGLVMRYASREGMPVERSHLILRAFPLGVRKLSWVLEENETKPLRRAPGVRDVKVKEGTAGGRRGIGLAATRAGDGWTFLHKVFSFQLDGTVFIVEHVVPAPKARAEAAVLESFVASLAFRN